MFKAALFTIAKTQKQHKYPSTGKWIKRMWCIHTVENYKAVKKSEIMPLATTWLQLEMIILTEVSQRYHMMSLVCGIQKNDTNELILKTNRHRRREGTYGQQRGREG